MTTMTDSVTANEPKRISVRDFIMVWNKSSNTKEVADKLGISRQVALAKAHHYRTKFAIPLKKLTILRESGIDWNEMRQLAIDTQN